MCRMKPGEGSQIDQRTWWTSFTRFLALLGCPLCSNAIWSTLILCMLCLGLWFRIFWGRELYSCDSCVQHVTVCWTEDS